MNYPEAIGGALTIVGGLAVLLISLYKFTGRKKTGGNSMKENPERLMTKELCEERHRRIEEKLVMLQESASSLEVLVEKQNIEVLTQLAALKGQLTALKVQMSALKVSIEKNI